MQKYEPDYDGMSVDPKGRYYLVAEVDAALAEKDIARLRRAGCECLAPLVGSRPDGRVRCRLCNHEEPDNEQIERLSGDLSANATMLSRQCDLAREAERETLSSRREVKKCEEQIAALKANETHLRSVIEE